MSGVMNPFDTLFGVVIRRVSSSRALTLPSLLATNPRVYRRRPTSTMSARICSSARVLKGKQLSRMTKFVSALLRAEILSLIGDGGFGRDVGPADGIAH